MSGKNRLVVGFIVLLLIVSTLTILVTPAKSAGITDQELTENDQYGWLYYVNVDGSYSEGDDEPDNDVYVGEKNVDIQMGFQENFTNSANITNQEVLIDEVQRLIGDDWESMASGDWQNSADVFEWTDYEQLSDTGPFDNFVDLSTFNLNVSDEATPGIYRVPVELMIENETTPGGAWDGPHTDVEYVYLEVAGNVAVNNIDLDPGITFESHSVGLHVDGNSGLTDVYLSLDESDLDDGNGNSVTIHNPDDESYVDEITTGPPDYRNGNVRFRFTVPMAMEPGEYEVDYDLTATRTTDDVTVTEHGTITITINKLAELSADIESNEIEQGTVKEEFTVTFTNTGNLDLERVRIRPYVGMWSPWGDPFTIPSEYYQHGGPTVDDPWLDIGDLPVGESNDTSFVLGIDQNIEVGSHKIPFEFEGYYYDELGEMTGQEDYYEVNDWDWVADTDEPSAWINVTKPEVSSTVDATSISSVSMNDMGYRPIEVRIQNNGDVSFSDVVVELHTSETPFVNPKDSSEDTIEMTDTSFTLSSHSSRYINFGVNVDTEFIQERLENDEPVYSVGLTLHGINTDTLDEEEIFFTVDGYVYGMGPKLVVTGEPSDNTVEPGERFNLTYTIKNIGDEPVRELMAMISPHEAMGSVDFSSFESGQEAVYYKQATTPPGAYIWSVEPEKTKLNPGESTTVTFEMISSSDMQNGAVYHLDLTMRGQGPSGTDSWESSTTVRSAEGESAKPMLSEQSSWIIVAIILGIFFLIGVLLYKRDGLSFGGSKGPEEESEWTSEETEEEMTFEEEFPEEEEELELEEGEIEPEGEDESEWTGAETSEEEPSIEEDKEW